MAWRHCCNFDYEPFVSTSSALRSEAKVHYTLFCIQEYAVANYLIDERVMVSDKCTNCKTLKAQNFWKISMPGNGYLQVDGAFEMSKVDNTNTFVIIKEAQITGGTVCDCSPKKVSLSASIGDNLSNSIKLIC